MTEPTIIGVVSQKGGVGKSTIARMIARELAHNGFRTLIADTDNGQSTSTTWVAARHKNGVTPEIIAQPTASPKRALEQGFEAVVFDGKPHSTNETVEIAKLCTLVVLPSGVSVDDLRPAVVLAHQLKAKGVGTDRLLFVLTRTSDSEAEIRDAREYLAAAGYTAAATDLPERTGYRAAQNMGRAVTETAFPSLNQRADKVAQEVFDRLESLTRQVARI